MQLKQLFNDDDAVSPVIGVILMVAITVILAAVIATFVLGLGEQVSETAPNASFDFDYDSSATSADTGTTTNGAVTVTHSGGPNIDAGQLRIAGDVTGAWTDKSGVSAGDAVSAGDSLDVGVASGDRINIVWDNEDGSESSILQSFDVP